MTPNKEEYSHKRIQTSNRIVLDRVLKNDELDLFDKSVIKGIYAPHRELEDGGKHHDAVSKVILNPAIDKDAMLDIGVDLGIDIIQQSTSARNRIVAFLNANRVIDDLRLEVLGNDTRYDVVLGIGTYMRSILLTELLQTKSTETVFEAIEATLQKAYDLGDNVEQSQYETHLSRLISLRSRYDTYKHAKDIGEKYDVSDEVDEDEYRSLKQNAALLSKEAMRHRKYGTKPAYIDASMGGAWIFYDGEDWRQKMSSKSSGAANYANVAAVVGYSPYNEFKSLRFQIDRSNPNLSMITGPVMDKINFLVYIGQDGAISMDLEGVEDLGLDLNLSHIQELSLRAEIASNFYDLSMPVMKHLPEDKVFEDLVDRKKQKFNPIKELLIPRIRYIEQGEYFTASDDVTRTIREHDVVWFVRTLPPGWHASPDAVAEAEAYGIELAENETFVKAHTRGKGNKVMGYHAVRHTAREQL